MAEINFCIVRSVRFGSRVRRGFTLIELLVVISIIALLIALLLPALGSASESARTAQCLSNTKQFATAAFTHAADNRQQIPLGGEILADNATVRRIGRNLKKFERGGFSLPMPLIAGLSEYMDADIRLNDFTEMQADLNDKDKAKFFICPSDEDPISVRQVNYVNQGFTSVFGISSYGPNDSLVGYDTYGSRDRVYGMLDKVYETSKVMMLGDIEPPASGGTWATFYENREDVTLYDAWAGTGGGLNDRFCDNSSGKSQERHKKELMNIAFADGHAQGIKIRNQEEMEDVYLSKGLGRE